MLQVCREDQEVALNCSNDTTESATNVHTRDSADGADINKTPNLTNNVTKEYEEFKENLDSSKHVQDLINVYPLWAFNPAERTRSKVERKVSFNPGARAHEDAWNTTTGVELPLIHHGDLGKIKLRRQRGRSVNMSENLLERKIETRSKSLIATEGSENLACALDLFGRGLIPPNAQVQFNPPIIRTSTALMHDIKENRDKTKISVSDFRVNECSNITNQLSKRQERKGTRTQPGHMQLKAVQFGNGKEKIPTEITVPCQPPPTPTRDAQVDMVHWLLVRGGNFDHRCAVFLDFKEQHRHLWPRISQLIEQMEQLFAAYNVTTVVVNGKQLVDLADKFADSSEEIPTVELASCVENAEQIFGSINRPMHGKVRRFGGPDGLTKAAVIIQSHVRRIVAQKRYKEHRRRCTAANVIRTAWLRIKAMKQIRKSLAATRAMHVLLSQQRLKNLELNWDAFLRKDHVLVHVPSVGYSPLVRSRLRDSGELQHMEIRQIARLCEVRRPNTRVILVTRASIPDDLLEYYDNLLGLAGGIRTGEAKDRCSQSHRFRIVVPEVMKHFQSPAAPPLCLSSLLKYSPNALKKIRTFIVGRPAILVPGFGTNLDDFAVAAALGIPVWTARPNVVNLFMRQSACRRLIKQISEKNSSKIGVCASKARGDYSSRINARRNSPEVISNYHGGGKSSRRSHPDKSVSQPPGDYDVYSLDRLHETMAALFTENLPTNLWLLKIDETPIPYGTARIDLRHLPSFSWALKQRELNGPEKWLDEWVREPTYMRVLAEVPELLRKHLELCNHSVYPDKRNFLKSFLSEGGVIEACPPVPEWTTLFVDMAITPNGQIEFLTSGNLLYPGNSLCDWGATVPMSSVDPAWVNEVCIQLANAMIQKDFVGHFRIECVTFIHPESDQQILWVTGIRPGYSDTLAMAQLVMFATDARLRIDPDSGTHSLQSRLPVNNVDDGVISETTRFAVLSAHLRHSGLMKLQYSAFFQICRSRYIGFNLKDRCGALFCPMDSCRREHLGMITISGTLERAIEAFSETLREIHSGISTSKMLANNFQSSMKELKRMRTLILGHLKEQQVRRSASADRERRERKTSGTNLPFEFNESSQVITVVHA